MSRTLKCECGKTADTDSNNVAVMIEQTGFTPVFCEDGNVVQYCDECKDKIVKHVEAILALSNDNDFLSWLGLVRLSRPME